VDGRSEQASATTAVVVGAGVRAFELVWRAARPVRAASVGLLRFGVATSSRLAPTAVAALAVRGRSGLADLQGAVDAVLRFAVARVIAAFLAQVDVTALVREHVDLDAIAAGIDVDKIVSRVDLEAVVRRIDLDAIAVGLDVDAVVGRVDLEAVVRRIDLDAIALGLDVDAVVGRVDLDAIVHRMDLVGIAREVVDGIDLAEIIRQSTGALTSDSVRTIRTEAMHADDVLSGVVDRVLGRRRPRPDVGTVG
jgi:hypothetical protein